MQSATQATALADSTNDDLRQINEAVSKITVHGQRYAEASQRMIDR